MLHVNNTSYRNKYFNKLRGFMRSLRKSWLLTLLFPQLFMYTQTAANTDNSECGPSSRQQVILEDSSLSHLLKLILFLIVDFAVRTLHIRVTNQFATILSDPQSNFPNKRSLPISLAIFLSLPFLFTDSFSETPEQYDLSIKSTIVVINKIQVLSPGHLNKLFM